MNEWLGGLAAVRKLSFAGDRSTFASLLAPWVHCLRRTNSRRLPGTLAPFSSRGQEGSRKNPIPATRDGCGTQDDLLGKWSLISLSCPGCP